MIEELQTKRAEHFQTVTDLSDLTVIQEGDVNIAMHERTISGELSDLVQAMLEEEFAAFNKPITLKDFEASFRNHFSKNQFTTHAGYEDLIADVGRLLDQFSKVCKTGELKLFFGRVATNMCSRFHVDMYELRMLCTYAGQGTLWLTNDNINIAALRDHQLEEEIPLRAKDIRQLNATDVAIIKGALYPNSSVGALVHKSPPIEHLNEKRLMLRVDSNSLFDRL